MLLDQKIIVISGVGPGLGLQLAREAANQGAKLVLASRSQDNLENAKAAVLALQPTAQILLSTTDITQEDQCEVLVKQTVQRFERIDCLVNSAYHPGGMDSLQAPDYAAWRAALEVNLFGTMNLTLACLPVMKRQKCGAIVNVNTMVTRKPLARQAGYAASKAALASATQHLAFELGAYGIRVNSAFLGWMWGPAVKSYFKQLSCSCGKSVEDLVAEVTKNIPLGRIPTDSDCAKSVIFLASDYACALTGACLDVNGGEYLPR